MCFRREIGRRETREEERGRGRRNKRKKKNEKRKTAGDLDFRWAGAAGSTGTGGGVKREDSPLLEIPAAALSSKAGTVWRPSCRLAPTMGTDGSAAGAGARQLKAGP